MTEQIKSINKEIEYKKTESESIVSSRLTINQYQLKKLYTKLKNSDDFLFRSSVNQYLKRFIKSVTLQTLEIQNYDRENDKYERSIRIEYKFGFVRAIPYFTMTVIQNQIRLGIPTHLFNFY